MPEPGTIETKSFPLKVKSVAEDGTFEGYAAVFGNVDLDGDVIDPKAFNRSLSQQKSVPILWQHEPARPAGVSLELAADAHGLRLKGRLLLTTTIGREAYEYVKAGIVKGLSIGCSVITSDWRDSATRVLKELRLHEISLVSIPANPLAEVTSVKHCAGCPRIAAAELNPETQDAETPPAGAPVEAAIDPDDVRSFAAAVRGLRAP